MSTAAAAAASAPNKRFAMLVALVLVGMVSILCSLATSATLLKASSAASSASNTMDVNRDRDEELERLRNLLANATKRGRDAESMVQVLQTKVTKHEEEEEKETGSLLADATKRGRDTEAMVQLLQTKLTKQEEEKKDEMDSLLADVTKRGRDAEAMVQILQTKLLAQGEDKKKEETDTPPVPVESKAETKGEQYDQNENESKLSSPYAEVSTWLLDSDGFATDHNAHKYSKADEDSSPLLKLEEFGIVTATSDNHLRENAKMLLSLREVQYKGPVYVYIIRLIPKSKEKGKVKRMTDDYIHQVLLSELNVTVLDYFVDSARAPVKSFCFKGHTIQRTLQENPQIKHVYWADSSTRWLDNPFSMALRMQRDGIMFAATPSKTMGMAENTDPRTYTFLNKTKYDYYQFTEIEGAPWGASIYPPDERSFWPVLQQYLSCGSYELCRLCMAPNLRPGIGKKKIKGPGSLDFLVPRQDQAVMGLLVYEQIMAQNNTIVPHGRRIDVSRNKKYLNIKTNRNDKILSKDISDLNGNVTLRELPTGL